VIINKQGKENKGAKENKLSNFKKWLDKGDAFGKLTYLAFA
jgi:hypothetical protein